MVREVIAIKVLIGLRPNGHADHPDWLQLPMGLAVDTNSMRPDEIREARQAVINQHIHVGWKYDKTSGHQEDTPESPFGQQFGMLLVSEQFAGEAELLFPTLIERLDEAGAQDFWENKAHAHLPINNLDNDALLGLQAERSLKVTRNASVPVLAEVDARIDDALDPLSPTPGVRKNHQKMWADAKVKVGVTIKVLS